MARHLQTLATAFVLLAVSSVSTAQYGSGTIAVTNPQPEWPPRVLAVGAGTIAMTEGPTHGSPYQQIQLQIILGYMFQPSSIYVGGSVQVPAEVSASATLQPLSYGIKLDNVFIHHGGALRVSPSSVSSIQLLIGQLKFDRSSPAPTGRLDLTDSSILITDTSAGAIGQIRELLLAGTMRNRGITSSSLGGGRALGYAPSTPVDRSTGIGNGVVIRQVAVGDANLDGFVTKRDYFAVTNSFAQSDAFWTSGDFNYDGVVDTIDYNAMLANLSTKWKTEILADMTGANASPAGAGAPTPEPSVAATLAIASSTLVLRRRNSKSS